MKLDPVACIAGALLGTLAFLVLSCAAMEPPAQAERPTVEPKPAMVAPYRIKVCPEQPAARREAIILPGECY